MNKTDPRLVHSSCYSDQFDCTSSKFLTVINCSDFRVQGLWKLWRHSTSNAVMVSGDCSIFVGYSSFSSVTSQPRSLQLDSILIKDAIYRRRDLDYSLGSSSMGLALLVCGHWGWSITQFYDCPLSDRSGFMNMYYSFLALLNRNSNSYSASDWLCPLSSNWVTTRIGSEGFNYDMVQKKTVGIYF